MPRGPTSCIAWASLKTITPKCSAALNFTHFVRELAPSGTRFFGYFDFVELVPLKRSSVLCFKL